MKISCQSCAAKYTIADEKVVGKVIKIKCKKCSSTIVVNGNDPNVLAQLQSGDAAAFEDQAATQLLQQPPGAYGGGNPDEWTVSISDEDQRTMTTAQILTEYAKGTLNTDTYVWKDGMGDWLPLTQVPELAGLLAASGGAPPAESAGYDAAPAYEQPAYQQPAYEQTAPVAAAAAVTSAARKAGGGRGSSVDLFGGGGAAEVVRPEATAPLPMAPGSDKHVGERNETSVLFSLKDLAAAEAAATTKSAAPPKKSSFDNRNDRVDDILSLGSVAAAPMLAPPPMNAPIIEPPPPPPSVAPVSAGAMATPAMYMQPAAKKGPPIGIIVGGVGALALIGGIAFFVMAGGDKSASAKDNKTASGETTSKSDAKTDTTTKAADTATAKPTETAAPTATTTETAAPESSGDPKATTTSTAKLASNDPKTDPTAKTDPKTDPKKEEPKEEPKKEEPKTGGGDTPFDRGAASAALSGAAGGAKGCKKADGPTGSAKVQVTFAPSGKATQATVGPPFAGTPVGSCIAGAFRGLSVPPFSGAPVTVSKTVNIK